MTCIKQKFFFSDFNMMRSNEWVVRFCLLDNGLFWRHGLARTRALQNCARRAPAPNPVPSYCPKRPANADRQARAAMAAARRRHLIRRA